MKFSKVSIIDWYDNILKAFATDSDGKIYYCTLLALDQTTNKKVYLCVSIEYLFGFDELLDITKADSFEENWNKLVKLVKIKKRNETFLIKATNLREEGIELIRYKTDFAWPNKVVWGEYPEYLNKAKKIDDWWSY